MGSMLRRSLGSSWLIPVCRMRSRALRRACRIRAAKNWPCWCGRASSWWISIGRLLNEAEALIGELPARLSERLPSGAGVAPRLTAAARPHLSGDRLADLRLQVLRLKAREHRLLVSDCALLERHIAQVLKLMGTHLTALGGLGTLGAAEVLVEVGDPRRFRSADAFASYTGTAPIPASSAESRGHPVHPRLSRFGNRRLNAVLYSMAVTRLRCDPMTQAYVGRLLAAGKTKRDALRILKRRLAWLVWMTQRCQSSGPIAR